MIKITTAKNTTESVSLCAHVAWQLASIDIVHVLVKQIFTMSYQEIFGLI